MTNFWQLYCSKKLRKFIAFMFFITIVVLLIKYIIGKRKVKSENANSPYSLLKKPEIFVKKLDDSSRTPFSPSKTFQFNPTEFELYGVPVNYELYTFYYAWYGAPHVDGRWIHWNHELIRHWDASIAANYPAGRHTPPNDIGADFYPSLGPYSSRDPITIRQHMQMIRFAGIGVVVVSWYPPHTADPNGQPVDALIPFLLDTAHDYRLKLALHIEPYHARSPASLARDARYIHKKYARHPAYHKLPRHHTNHHRHHHSFQQENKEKLEKESPRLPVVFVYDSYLIEGGEWRSLLQPGGAHSIRETPGNDLFVIGLAMRTNVAACDAMRDAGFDGVYTYFASEANSQASQPEQWPELIGHCQGDAGGGGEARRPLIVVVCAGPGYLDVAVRPWNSAATRSRKKGRRLLTQIKSLIGGIARDPRLARVFSATNQSASGGRSRPINKLLHIGITSFNEWHEGTQIEPANPRPPLTRYRVYGRGEDAKADPLFYLRLTRQISKWVTQFNRSPNTPIDDVVFRRANSQSGSFHSSDSDDSKNS